MNIERIKEVTAELNRTTPDNIVSVGYGYKEKDNKTLSQRSITFTVTEKKPLSEIPENERIPSEVVIDGETYVTDVVQGVYELQAYVDCSGSDPDFYAWSGTTPANRDKIRPIQGGISVSNYTSRYSYVGTLGFVAVDNDTNSLVGVSNNHVLIDDAVFASSRPSTGSTFTNVAGDISTQPNESINRSLSNRIGLVKKYQPIHPSPSINYVDAACIALDQTVVSDSDSWKQYGITGMTSAPRFATTQEIDTVLNDPNKTFYSSGRTTGAKGEGLTKLYCVVSSSSVNLQYPSQGGAVVCTMNESFELAARNPSTPEGDWCTYPSTGGDSGSAILTEINGEFVIVGLLYAGRRTLFGLGPSIITVCCRIDRVAEALNISAWNGSLSGVSFSNNSSPETVIIAGQSSEKTVTLNGKIYWQVGVTTSSPT